MEKETLMKTIGNNLQELRTKRGMTQEKLAESVGISTSFYANIERGIKGVSILVLYNLAACLGVSVDYFLYEKADDAHIRIIENLLRDKPPYYVETLEKLADIITEMPHKN